MNFKKTNKTKIISNMKIQLKINKIYKKNITKIKN